MVHNPFFAAVLREVPRLLGQMDRNPLSPTYGSCDRAFWHYRTNDISSMRYQEAALTFALLYVTPFEGNEYCGDKQMLAWANAAIRFACSHQHTDGSFDEWYLNEGSFVCTAFVSDALSEAALVLGEELLEREELIAALKRSGMWLMRHSETLVVNQLSGAISALRAIYELTGEVEYKEAAEAKCTVLLSLQHEEGWWSEYGGPDAGYLSLAIQYLSKYAERANDVRVQGAIDKAAAFLLYFINPDGTAGGEYLSRNTEYLIPSGCMRAAAYSPSSRIAASRVAELVTADKGITPRTLDDRYICYILYTWIEAGIAWDKLDPSPTVDTTMPKNSGITFFPDAGLFVGGYDSYQIFGNLKKGGSLRLYVRDAALIDSGVSVRLNGAVYAGNVLDQDTQISYDASTATLRSLGKLIRVQAPLLTTGRALLLKTAQWLFGRIPVLQKLLKRILRTVSVMRPGSSSGLRYERAITINDRAITITDTLNALLPRETLFVGQANIYALVPSSRYMTAQPEWADLQPQSESYETLEKTTRLSRVFAL